MVGLLMGSTRVGSQLERISTKVVFSLFPLLPGKFAQILIGVNTRSGQNVVIILENTNNRDSVGRVFHEASMYQRLNGSPGIPSIYSAVEESDYRALVIDPLGHSLEELFSLCKRKFTLKTVLMIGDQLLTRMELIHDKNIVHQRVEPNNFLIGCGKFENQIHVIDFQAAKINTRSSQHGGSGYYAFSSAESHYGGEQSPKDDLESLWNMLVCFLRGSLPWDGLKADSEQGRHLQLMEKRLRPINELHTEFEIARRYIRALEPGQRPDYSHLRNIFNKLWVCEGYRHDNIFDWTDKLDRGGGASVSLNISKLEQASKVEYLRTLGNEMKASWGKLKEVWANLDRQEISETLWMVLARDHTSVLNKFYDFFLATNDSVMVDTKYVDIMWQNVIMDLANLMHRNLTTSREHIHMFLESSYRMMVLLVETVPALKALWIEYLGHLSHARMVVSGSSEKVIYRGLARDWFTKAADLNPNAGYLQYYISCTAYPDVLCQLFYFYKAMASVQPFAQACEDTLKLFGDLESVESRENDTLVLKRFIEVHKALFIRESPSTLNKPAQQFLGQLCRHAELSEHLFHDQGVWIATINFAAIFGPGNPLSLHDDAGIEINKLASRFAFSTLDTILERIHEGNIMPHVHISLAFILCMAKVPKIMAYIEADVPWSRLATFMNAQIRPDSDISELANNNFDEGYLREDFMLRGTFWSQFYYPSEFSCVAEVDHRQDLPAEATLRLQRSLGLIFRIAEVSRKLSVYVF
jgi:casein kinase I homolog HRR25